LRTRRLTRESASAAAVPNTVATSAEATRSAASAWIADVIDSSSSARPNHFVEKPANDATLSPALNAKIHHDEDREDRNR
jgi:hypothetical protein